jgi:hypothetical protein
MTDLTESRLGWGFAVLGAALIAVGAIIALVTAVADLVGRHGGAAAGQGATALVLFVVGALAFFFAYLGHRSWSDRPVVTGILLIVIAVVGWAALGLGANVVALIGGLFVFLAGVLYVVRPALDGMRRAISPA